MEESGSHLAPSVKINKQKESGKKKRRSDTYHLSRCPSSSCRAATCEMIGLVIVTERCQIAFG
ncbi:hypothetical protein OUZ56_015481 [Daphnia magna]|uniref:Uncharacterized protein n=1 Tax=Daphnia magna TaxID=35525 RepID=A0ABR0AN58_9CRUS|nr:hypothetical protein OUZ56_015481 [Daphnia magna]